MIGRFFDGVSAVSHPVVLRVEEGFVIGEAPSGEHHFKWPVGLLVVMDAPTEKIDGIVSARHSPACRLHIKKADFDLLQSAAGGQADFSEVNTSMRLKWIVVWSGGALGSLAVLFFSIPLLAGFLAPVVPDSWMAELGDASLASVVGQNKCTHAQGIDAFNVMLADLVPTNADAEYPMQITVINEPIINAYAMPGNHIVFFQGLIDAAETPEEIAGILAHEIGHHQANHIKERMVSQAGLSLIAFAMTGTDGGILATLGLQFASLSYSRSDEREADALAVDLLERANISPLGLKTFFERLADREAENGGPLEIMSTHPDSEARAASIVPRPEGEYKPALSEGQWQALQQVCTP